MRVRVLKPFADDNGCLHRPGEVLELTEKAAGENAASVEEVARYRVKKKFIDKHTDEAFTVDKVVELNAQRAAELADYIEAPNKLSLRKMVLIAVGCVGVGLGAVGAVLPFLPAFPFLLVAALCFGRSSDKLDTWFKGTKLYKNNLETYVKGQGMTWGAKIRVMIMVSILMAIGFIIMTVNDVIIYARFTLAAVWVFHILYFCFGVKEYDPNRAPRVKKINREKFAVV